MSQKSIRDRLENWAAWCGMPAYHGADSMTAAVCDRMRRAALGNVWSGHGDTRVIDIADAALVERAWGHMANWNEKMLLRWYYVRRAHADLICRKLKIKRLPFSNFVHARCKAEESIAAVIKQMAAGSAARFK